MVMIKNWHMINRRSERFWIYVLKCELREERHCKVVVEPILVYGIFNNFKELKTCVVCEKNLFYLLEKTEKYFHKISNFDVFKLIKIMTEKMVAWPFKVTRYALLFSFIVLFPEFQLTFCFTCISHWRTEKVAQIDWKAIDHEICSHAWNTFITWEAKNHTFSTLGVSRPHIEHFLSS